MPNWKKELATAQLVRNRLAGVSRGLWPTDVPRPRATESAIAAAEERVGAELDPEYKEFLRHADGWPAFYKAVDLFGCAELGAGVEWERAWELLREVAPVRTEDGREFALDALLPIAVSRCNSNVFCIAPDASTGSGRILWINSGVVEEFASFSEFFFAMLDYARETIKRFETGKQ